MGDLPWGGVFFGGIFPKIPIFPSFSPHSHSSFPLIPTQPRLPVFRASGMRIPLGIGAPGIFLNLFFPRKTRPKAGKSHGSRSGGAGSEPKSQNLAEGGTQKWLWKGWDSGSGAGRGGIPGSGRFSLETERNGKGSR